MRLRPQVSAPGLGASSLQCGHQPARDAVEFLYRPPWPCSRIF